MKLTDLNISNDLRTIVAITLRDDMKRHIRENRIKPKTKKSSGTTLVQSGNLVNSIDYRLQGSKIIISSPLPYAKIHHTGGVIRPKRAKFLAIPLTPLARTMRPRDFQDTFISKGVIFRKLEGDKIEALYALKKQVVMPAQPFMLMHQSGRDKAKSRIQGYWRTHGTL
jgi:phage gpG-like protein